MRFIICKKCGAEVSDQYSYCTHCQAPLTKKANASETEFPPPPEPKKWLLTPIDPDRKPKLQIPTGLRQGAYVGAFVGLISGVITISLILIVSPLIKLAVTEYLAQQLPSALSVFPALWNRVLANLIVIFLIVDTIGGAIAGFLFVAFMENIPGRSMIRKSVVFSVILLAIYLLTGALLSYFDPRMNYINGATFASLRSLSLMFRAFRLVEYPLLGCLFGYLLDRRLKPR